MSRKYDVIIVGGGTAGLAALREVRKATRNFLVVNDGPYGTTCARVGCMPAKSLVQAAKDFHRRMVFPELGIYAGQDLILDTMKVLTRVRELRDGFVEATLDKTFSSLGKRHVRGHATLVGPDAVSVGNRVYRARRIVLASGSVPDLSDVPASVRDRVITNETLFELPDLPSSVAVVGVGKIGLSIAQALRRLGVNVIGVGRSRFVGGLSDPRVNAYAVERLAAELPLWVGHSFTLEPAQGKVAVRSGKRAAIVDHVLVVDRRPGLDGLGLERVAGIALDRRGVPRHDRGTMQIGSLPLFLAGDVRGGNTSLHEAEDDGTIAGHNAVASEPARFRRRARLDVCFTDPNIAIVGKRSSSLRERGALVGEVTFEDQGRSKTMAQNLGMLRLYASRDSGRLLGAELMAPAGEHLAHLLSWAVQRRMKACDVLRLPFYHPTVEEGVRTALRAIVAQLPASARTPELRCLGPERPPLRPPAAAPERPNERRRAPKAPRAAVRGEGLST